MPPRKSNLSLTQDEIDLIRRWVAEGAEYKPHWAFLPLPDAVPVPPVSGPKLAGEPDRPFRPRAAGPRRAEAVAAPLRGKTGSAASPST